MYIYIYTSTCIYIYTPLDTHKCIWHGILNRFFFPSQFFLHPKVQPKGSAALLVDPSYLCLHQAQQ